MIDWIHKKQHNADLKKVREQALRQSLADKISNLETDDCDEHDDHTVVSINGRKLRVPKEQITIYDVS